MKNSSMNTHLGNIVIDNEVIAQYAGSVATGSAGVVGMAGVNVKDGIVSLLKKENISRGINVVRKGNTVVIDMHIIVSYGVSIMSVANNLMDSVKYEVENSTGLEVEKVNIYVEGVRVID